MLGNLKKVDLRKAWSHEAHDFTNWLAKPENLSLLSEEIGIEISLIQTEYSVGKYFVDIYAEESTSSKKVIIENQLESTDHDHLGKVLTYAAGVDASFIIWIVKDVREEHQRAVDWLNEHTDTDINFFAIKMELWQIADSPYAPKFHIISEPNEWAKEAKQMASQAQLSDTKLMQLDFWKQFKEHMEQTNSSLSMRKPKPQHWYNVSIGSSGCHMALTMDTQKKKFGVEIYIPDNQELFTYLHEQRLDIEDSIGEDLIWMPLENKKACRIKLERDADPENIDSWPEYNVWLKEKAELFAEVFGIEVANF